MGRVTGSPQGCNRRQDACWNHCYPLFRTRGTARWSLRSEDKREDQVIGRSWSWRRRGALCNSPQTSVIGTSALPAGPGESYVMWKTSCMLPKERCTRGRWDCSRHTPNARAKPPLPFSLAFLRVS